MFKLIACNVFQREVCHCLARTARVVDVEFTELGEHVRSAGLRALIQGRIDAAEHVGKNYEAILLLFGLCGNAGAGLQARGARLVIPRAHDCCTILLGAKEKFRAHFEANPSTPFGSVGYWERGNYFLRTAEDGDARVVAGDAFAALVQQYGPDDARYIWDQMHPQDADPRAVFIDLPETAHLGVAEKFRAKVEAAGKTCVELSGSLRLIHMLIEGEWPEHDFLVVPPGGQTVGVYDWEQVMQVRPSA